MREEIVNNMLKRMTIDEKIKLCMGKNSWTTQEFDNLGIPSIKMSDGTNGVRFQKGSDKQGPYEFYQGLKGSFDSPEALKNTYYATCFPAGSAIACSWNQELIAEVGKALARECQCLEINMLLGPGMNIRRHPLTARNFEYYSEDPFLTGKMASGLVKAVQSQGVGTSIKHFACHNSDTRRTRVNVKVDERALREIYLAGYERVIKEAKPTAVMTAYNKINDVEVNENKNLLETILRDEWKFEGVTISDWGAVKNIAEASKAGLDLQMPRSMSSAKYMKQCIKEGSLSVEILDRKVRNILNLVTTLKEQEVKRKDYDHDAHHLLAKKAALESIVLLKNDDQILPIDKDKVIKIAVIGGLAKNPLYMGTGCAIVRSQKIDIPYKEIEKYCDGKIQLLYEDGYYQNGTTDERLIDKACKLAEKADIVLVFAGQSLPEESDDFNRRNMKLDGCHEYLIDKVSKANVNTVAILCTGDVVEMPFNNQVKGIIETWYSGESMGSALAEILFGLESPSGKLAVTMPDRIQDTPAYLSFADNPFEMVYSESIFVGYRYYDKKELDVLYPFGHGLTYTDFHYSNLVIESQTENKFLVTVEVTNVGKVKGKETVQLYLSAKNSTVLRPIRELKGFKKVELNPGDTKKVSFLLKGRDFTYYDSILKNWIIDNTIFEVSLGDSSRNIIITDEITVIPTDKRYEKIKNNSGFFEMFQNEENIKIFLGYLVKHNIITEDQAKENIGEKLLETFWSIRSYMDMNSNGKFTYEMSDEIIEIINSNWV